MAYYNHLQLGPKNQVTYLIVVYISNEERVCFYLTVVYILQKSLLLQCYVTRSFYTHRTNPISL